MLKLDDFRRVFIFEYKFRESTNLHEIREKFEGMFDFENPVAFNEILSAVKETLVKGYHLCLPEKFENRVIAMKSAVVHPPMILFWILQNSEEGGFIMLLETKDSWYSYEKILLSMRSFCKNAGIKCRFKGCLNVKRNISC